MITGKQLDFTSQGNPVSAYLAQPEQGGPGVLVLHAWWGLTPFFKSVCDRLAAEGYTALAPDLYGGVTATTITEAQEALTNSSDVYIEAAVLGALEQIRSLPGVQPGRIGVIGFSMGAAWAIVLSTLAPADIKAAIVFYGAYAVDFNRSQAAYQGHFAEVDEWEPTEGVQQMLAEMNAARRPAELHTYPGTGHWFFEDDRPQAFDPKAAALAWERSLAFLAKYLV
jgi:carboxymethylenebutenolidase